MSRKIIERVHYEHSEFDDPRLPRNEKSWLNARSMLVRRMIRKLRREGVSVPPHNSEFVIACAAPFRFSSSVTDSEVENMILIMIPLFNARTSSSEKQEPPLSAAS